MFYVARLFIVAVVFCSGMFGPLFMALRPSEAFGEERAKDISSRYTTNTGHAPCVNSDSYRPYQHGLASWYGPGFHGKKMANGRTFDMGRLTVAHKTLRLGSEVCIINKENGRSIRATVTDRGPYIPPRIVDLSKRVADELGVTERGVAPVTITLRRG